MRSQFIRRLKSNPEEAGQAMLEFAAMTVVLLLLTMGIIDLSRIVFFLRQHRQPASQHAALWHDPRLRYRWQPTPVDRL